MQTLINFATRHRYAKVRKGKLIKDQHQTGEHNRTNDMTGPKPKQRHVRTTVQAAVVENKSTHAE